MKEYDVIVIGSGCGMAIVEAAVFRGMSVALIERGPVGGTCPNTGCIPSKVLIHVADRIMEMRDSAKLGIRANIENIDFSFIMERMRRGIRDRQQEQRGGLIKSKEIDFYDGQGHFVEDYIIEVGRQSLKGRKIFIAVGSRPFIPPIKGLETIDFLTNETILELEEKPSSLVIIGGGYIAVEYGHFFEAMGTEVTIVEMADRLLLPEEPEISETLLEELSKRMSVQLNSQAKRVQQSDGGVRVTIEDTQSGIATEVSAERLLIAVGRRSNADQLNLENTGVEVDARGYVKVDEYLETTRKDIFAVGDINGQMMFTHVGNTEAELAAINALDGRHMKMDYRAAPHAVYSYPQIASVGLRQEEAKKEHKILIGRTMYNDTAKGEAMMEETGFAKAIVDEDTLEILGFHVIGPHAPILIQEVTNAMASGGHLDELINGIHIHPSLSEIIQSTVEYLEEPLEGHMHQHTH